MEGLIFYMSILINRGICSTHEALKTAAPVRRVALCSLDHRAHTLVANHCALRAALVVRIWEVPSWCSAQVPASKWGTSPKRFFFLCRPVCFLVGLARRSLSLVPRFLLQVLVQVAYTVRGSHENFQSTGLRCCCSLSMPRDSEEFWTKSCMAY